MNIVVNTIRTLKLNKTFEYFVVKTNERLEKDYNFTLCLSNENYSFAIITIILKAGKKYIIY